MYIRVHRDVTCFFVLKTFREYYNIVITRREKSHRTDVEKNFAGSNIPRGTLIKKNQNNFSTTADTGIIIDDEKKN